MTYAGLHMFMEKLNQLINWVNNPFLCDNGLIKNYEIFFRRTKFQRLHEQLGSMIQTLFIDQHQHLHDLQRLNDLKKKFTYVAEEAQYIVDLFLSGAHIRLYTKNLHTYEDIKRSLKLNDAKSPFEYVVYMFLPCLFILDDWATSREFERPLNIDNVRRSFKSIKVEFMSMINNSMKIDSSPRTEATLNQSNPAQISITQKSIRTKKLLDEILVGLDHDVELIRDKLVEDQKKLDVVSIVGMGGIGKTALATKVFNDRYVKHHFHIRSWVTVSQTYDKRGVLIQILEFIHGQLDLEKASDSRLREMVHKHLTGQRYLIVIDDIWNTETWDNLKLFFPHDNRGSRLLLTSRITEVAKHANPDGLVHHLGYLSKDKSWELLSHKVFHGNEVPEWSVKPGMQIIESCQGLPLAVVIVAGVLAKEAWSEKFWVEIANKMSSAILKDDNGCLDTLRLSYNHLPFHLRECFLYLGGFPEDYKFKAQMLIWLWVAEGLIEQTGNRSLEDIAEGYLFDLIDKNLVNVAAIRKSNGGVKACKVHDLVRELCLKIAKEERFILQTERLKFSSQLCNAVTPPYKPVRMFINKDNYDSSFASPLAKNLRSILCFSNFRFMSDDVAKYFRSFVLLRVLDLHKCELDVFPKGMELLVHLRYLAICNSSHVFPSSICNLWNLQTLIYITDCETTNLPNNISDLINLRHFKSIKTTLLFPTYMRNPMSLQTISNMVLENGVLNFQNKIPCIKELTCRTYLDEENDFKSLTHLEKLHLTGMPRRMTSFAYDSLISVPMKHVTFPTTLKSLSLQGFCLPWSDMSIIQSLPNLQVLKLYFQAFKGSCWNTDKHEFPQLKFLRLEMLYIARWEVYSLSFPCLQQIEIINCRFLSKIPLTIGDIPTLELIKIEKCRQSVGKSVKRIQEEQHDLGNFNLKIDIMKESKLSIFDMYSSHEMVSSDSADDNI